MFKNVYDHVIFFKGKDEVFVATIVPFLQPLHIKENQYVYHNTDFSTDIFFITHGRINYVGSQYQIVLQSWINGSYFGELEILGNMKRTTSAIAQVQTQLLSLDKKHFLMIIQEFPDYAKEI